MVPDQEPDQEPDQVPDGFGLQKLLQGRQKVTGTIVASGS